MAKERPARQSVQLDSGAIALVAEISEETGLTKIEVIRRLLRWATEQDDVVRAEVLGTLPESLRTTDVARMVLERMAEGDTPPVAGKIKPSRGVKPGKVAAREADKGSRGYRPTKKK